MNHFRLFTALNKSCLLTSFLLISTISHAQQAPSTCPAGIPETANADAFTVGTTGEVLHIASQLIFMRCSIGQTWTGVTCANEPTAVNWQQALQLSVKNEFNDSKNWRLPNVKELSVITERACVRPAINDGIFPNTSPDDYWTSTPSIMNEQKAWAISFSNSSNAQRLTSRSLFVRLVRTRLADE
jgi:hypothetical protein